MRQRGKRRWYGWIERVAVVIPHGHVKWRRKRRYVWSTRMLTSQRTVGFVREHTDHGRSGQHAAHRHTAALRHGPPSCWTVRGVVITSRLQTARSHSSSKKLFRAHSEATKRGALSPEAFERRRRRLAARSTRRQFILSPQNFTPPPPPPVSISRSRFAVATGIAVRRSWLLRYRLQPIFSFIPAALRFGHRKRFRSDTRTVVVGLEAGFDWDGRMILMATVATSRLPASGVNDWSSQKTTHATYNQPVDTLLSAFLPKYINTWLI